MNYVGGNLGKVRIYNVVLTATEVALSWFADGPRFGFTGPTAFPTPQPTLLLNGPTPWPTTGALSSSPVPFDFITRGLVLSLDAVTYQLGANTWMDYIGGRAFTLFNNPTWSSAGGGSLAFVAANSQYAQSPALPSMATWTIEVWHMWTGLFVGVEPAIVTDMIGANLNFALGTSFTLPDLNAGWYSNPWRKTDRVALTPGMWLHIVASFDGTTGNIYVNNALKASTNMAGTPVTGNTGIRLMRRGNLADFWDGSLAKVKIYNVALTAAEVRHHKKWGEGRPAQTKKTFSLLFLLPNLPPPLLPPPPQGQH